jgi:hypothetical protein
MAEGRGSHAEHGPTRPPPTEFETFYPKGDIVAATEDRPRAEAVVRALRDAGFPAGDLDIVDPAVVLQAAEELRHRRGLLGRLGAIFGDDGYFADQFEELARRGYPLVVVHAPEREDAKRAAAILRAHGVRAGSYYGRLTITDL